MNANEIIEQLRTLIDELEVELKKKDNENAYLHAQLQEIIADKAIWRDYLDKRLHGIRKEIIEYGRRLQQLQIREARKGYDVEPAIVLEIQDIRTKIEDLYAELRKSEVRTDFLIRQITED